MSKIHLIIISLLLYLSVNSQVLRCGTRINLVDFESTEIIQKYITFDTSTVNIWTIGKPNKTKFQSAYTPNNAIFTGTGNYYPPNTYSSFTVKFFRDYLTSSDYCDSLYIEGYFKIDSDTLNDYGKIEMRRYYSEQWIDISSYPMYIDGIYKKPVFSGNLTDKWHQFCFALNPSSLDYFNEDTNVLIRFSFISDSIDTHKEGWILDNLSVNAVTPGGINDIMLSNDLIIIYPNPASQNDNFTISINKIEVESIQIYDCQGRLHNQFTKPRNSITLNTNQFSNGIYLIETIDKKGNRQIKELIIN
jgi:hypothetical protein